MLFPFVLRPEDIQPEEKNMFLKHIGSVLSSAISAPATDYFHLQLIWPVVNLPSEFPRAP